VRENRVKFHGIDRQETGGMGHERRWHRSRSAANVSRSHSDAWSTAISQTKANSRRGGASPARGGIRRPRRDSACSLRSPDDTEVAPPFVRSVDRNGGTTSVSSVTTQRVLCHEFVSRRSAESATRTSRSTL
jgi:hypothetical protein